MVSNLAPLSHPKLRPRVDARFILMDDLSDGQELFPVRVYNDVNRLAIKPFKYTKNIIDMEGYVRTPCVCQCKTVCDSRCLCMGEPFEPSVTEIAYEETTGHLKKPRSWTTSITPKIPRTIWECSAACRCGASCPSRSAQLGLRYPFEVYMTQGKGWGVRTLCDLPAGAFVAEYAGEMRLESDSDYWSEATWYTFCLQTGDDCTRYYLDASRHGNLTRFINHGCAPNVVAINVYYDDNNQERGIHVGVYTIKKVKAFEELTLDYAKEFWTAKMSGGEYCKCGASCCYYRDPSHRSSF